MDPLIIGSIFIVGMLFGIFILPYIIEFIEDTTIFTQENARLTSQNFEKLQQKSIRKSKVFKDRLESILSSIKEESERGNKSLKVAHIESCKTDMEIIKFLKKRKFCIDSDYRQNNTIIITWRWE